MENVLFWLRSCQCQKYDCYHKKAADEIESQKDQLWDQGHSLELNKRTIARLDQENKYLRNKLIAIERIIRE